VKFRFSADPSEATHLVGAVAAGAATQLPWSLSASVLQQGHNVVHCSMAAQGCEMLRFELAVKLGVPQLRLSRSTIALKLNAPSSRMQDPVGWFMQQHCKEAGVFKGVLGSVLLNNSGTIPLRVAVSNSRQQHPAAGDKLACYLCSSETGKVQELVLQDGLNSPCELQVTFAPSRVTYGTLVEADVLLDTNIAMQPQQKVRVELHCNGPHLELLSEPFVHINALQPNAVATHDVRLRNSGNKKAAVQVLLTAVASELDVAINVSTAPESPAWKPVLVGQVLACAPQTSLHMQLAATAGMKLGRQQAVVTFVCVNAIGPSLQPQQVQVNVVADVGSGSRQSADAEAAGAVWSKQCPSVSVAHNVLQHVATQQQQPITSNSSSTPVSQEACQLRDAAMAALAAVQMAAGSWCPEAASHQYDLLMRVSPEKVLPAAVMLSAGLPMSEVEQVLSTGVHAASSSAVSPQVAAALQAVEKHDAGSEQEQLARFAQAVLGVQQGTSRAVASALLPLATQVGALSPKAIHSAGVALAASAPSDAAANLQQALPILTELLQEQSGSSTARVPDMLGRLLAVLQGTDEDGPAGLLVEILKQLAAADSGKYNSSSGGDGSSSSSHRHSGGGDDDCCNSGRCTSGRDSGSSSDSDCSSTCNSDGSSSSNSSSSSDGAGLLAYLPGLLRSPVMATLLPEGSPVRALLDHLADPGSDLANMALQLLPAEAQQFLQLLCGVQGSRGGQVVEGIVDALGCAACPYSEELTQPAVTQLLRSCGRLLQGTELDQQDLLQQGSQELLQQCIKQPPLFEKLQQLLQPQQGASADDVAKRMLHAAIGLVMEVCAAPGMKMHAIHVPHAAAHVRSQGRRWRSSWPQLSQKRQEQLVPHAALRNLLTACYTAQHNPASVACAAVGAVAAAMGMPESPAAQLSSVVQRLVDVASAPSGRTAAQLWQEGCMLAYDLGWGRHLKPEVVEAVTQLLSSPSITTGLQVASSVAASMLPGGSRCVEWLHEVAECCATAGSPQAVLQEFLLRRLHLLLGPERARSLGGLLDDLLSLRTRIGRGGQQSIAQLVVMLAAKAGAWLSQSDNAVLSAIGKALSCAERLWSSLQKGDFASAAVGLVAWLIDAVKAVFAAFRGGSTLPWQDALLQVLGFAALLASKLRGWLPRLAAVGCLLGCGFLGACLWQGHAQGADGDEVEGGDATADDEASCTSQRAGGHGPAGAAAGFAPGGQHPGDHTGGGWAPSDAAGSCTPSFATGDSMPSVNSPHSGGATAVSLFASGHGAGHARGSPFAAAGAATATARAVPPGMLSMSTFPAALAAGYAAGVSQAAVQTAPDGCGEIATGLQGGNSTVACGATDSSSGSTSALPGENDSLTAGDSAGDSDVDGSSGGDSARDSERYSDGGVDSLGDSDGDSSSGDDNGSQQTTGPGAPSGQWPQAGGEEFHMQPSATHEPQPCALPDEAQEASATLSAELEGVLIAEVLHGRQMCLRQLAEAAAALGSTGGSTGSSNSSGGEQRAGAGATATPTAVQVVGALSHIKQAARSWISGELQAPHMASGHTRALHKWTTCCASTCCVGLACVVVS
jgi:hypothetical protein